MLIFKQTFIPQFRSYNFIEFGVIIADHKLIGNEHNKNNFDLKLCFVERMTKYLQIYLTIWSFSFQKVNLFNNHYSVVVN